MKKLFVVLVMLVSGLGYSQSPSDTIREENINLDFINQCVIVEINKERVKRGLNTFVVSEECMEFSKKHTEWMVRTGRYVHSKNETGRPRAECLNGVFITPNYQTYNDVAKHIVKKWMDSPPHKKILMGDYKECGTHIGIYEKSEITSTRSTYVTFSVVW